MTFMFESLEVYRRAADLADRVITGGSLGEMREGFEEPVKVISGLINGIDKRAM